MRTISALGALILLLALAATADAQATCRPLAVTLATMSGNTCRTFAAPIRVMKVIRPGS